MYHYSKPDLDHSHAYLLPAVSKILSCEKDRRVFDLGCGNGSFANVLTQQGFAVTGVDPSALGIAVGRQHFPHIRLEIGSAYDDLAAGFGTFPVVLGLEVVEHLYSPRRFAKCVFDLLEPGGLAVISTPFHGYWKNLALAISGKMDLHFGPLWDDGHIKFWSIASLTRLLTDTGFQDINFVRVGRLPTFAKSMVATARRPKG